jgi:hypothetical protein
LGQRIFNASQAAEPTVITLSCDGKLTNTVRIEIDDARIRVRARVVETALQIFYRCPPE